MPLDARAKRFLDTLAAVTARRARSLTIDERRSALQQLLSFSGAAESVAGIEDRTVPGPDGALTVRMYTPAAAAGVPFLPGLTSSPGGGLVAGGLDTHDPICRSLANASGCRVLSVDYRLAPEHPFPAAVADGCMATVWIGAHAREWGVDPDRLGICGDSAGATLAAVVCQSMPASRQARLAFQFLLCPITDFAAQSDSRRRFAQGYLLDQATLEHDLKYYLSAEADRCDPRISPLRAADLRDLPPTAIHTAEFDPLRDEGHAYAQALQAAGVRTICRSHPGMIHLFYGMGGLIPYAGAPFRQMGADIRSLLGST